MQQTPFYKEKRQKKTISLNNRDQNWKWRPFQPHNRKKKHAMVCWNEKAKVRETKEAEENQQFLGSVSLENIIASSKEDTINFQEKVKVTIKDQNYKFSVRYGYRFYRSSGLVFPTTQPTNKRLYGPSQHEIKVIGCKEATLSMK